MVLALSMWVLGGCGGAKDDFIGARVLDTCSDSWPVCDGYASCLLGAESYIQGNLPGSGRFAVQTVAPSDIKVSFYFENLTAAGGLFSIVWWEPGCTSDVRADVDGQDVAAEAEATGIFSRQAQLNVAGYHLVTFQATTQASYTMKVDVTPLAP
ncbi:MAG TPA: hypothetical protein VEJ89_15055 [Myxococcaceae bacterium]|nr:hypothetical protein [Myxococcaceae bacterium]